MGKVITTEEFNTRVLDYLEHGSKRFDSIEGLLKTHGNRIAAIEAMRERITPVGGFGKDDSKRPFSFAAVIRGMAAGGLDNPEAWKGAEREREAGLAARARALSTGVDASGGYLVGEEHLSDFIPLLVAKTVVMESGATSLTGLTGSPVTLTKQTGGATAQWQGEAGNITDSDQALGEVNLTPHMATAMTQMSRRLVAMSNPSAEAMVRNDLLGAMSRLIDLAALRGSGVANQPLGVANTPGIGTITAVGSPTIEDFQDALYKLELANAPMESLGIVCHPRTFHTLRKLRGDGGGGAGTGPFLLQPDPTKPTAFTLGGFPIRTTTALPINLGGGGTESVAYFAAWSELLVAMWGGLLIEATKEGGNAFATHSLYVKTVAEVDVATRHPEAFVELSGITA